MSRIVNTHLTASRGRFHYFLDIKLLEFDVIPTPRLKLSCPLILRVVTKYIYIYICNQKV